LHFTICILKLVQYQQITPRPAGNGLSDKS